MKRYNYLFLFAVTFALVESLPSSKVAAQAVGQRLYLRFNSHGGSSELNSTGVRILQNANRNKYWILGKADDDNTDVALIDPTTPTTPAHAHFWTTNTPNPQIFSASDFVLDPNNDAVVISALGLQSIQPAGQPPPPLFSNNSLSLFQVANTLALPYGNSNEFHMWGKSEAIGSAIKYDANTGDYVVVWNLVDSATSGNGTNLKDWGIARVVPGNPLTTTWEQVWTGTPANQHEEVRDVIVDGAGNYAACGRRTDFTNSRNGGLVTKVSNAGALIWQKAYNPGAGIWMEFNSISEMTVGGTTEYIAVGTKYALTNPLGQKRIVVVGINPANGAVLWSYDFRETTYGQDAEGFRHTIMSDLGIIIAGRLTDRNANRTTAMLLKVINPDRYMSPTCTGGGGTPIITWWAKYETYDNSSPIVEVSSELVDVCPMINCSDCANDVSAVGTALVSHNSQPIKDVMWIEAAKAAQTYPESFTGGNNGHCRTNPVDNECSTFSVDLVDLRPSAEGAFVSYNFDMTATDDDLFRTCEPTASSLGLEDTGYPKAPQDGDGSALSAGVNSLTVYPLPPNGTSCKISLTLSMTSTVQVDIIDCRGSTVYSLVPRLFSGGSHQIPLDLTMLSTGVYAVRAHSDTMRMTTLLPIVR